MALRDSIAGLFLSAARRVGRPRNEPVRDSDVYPLLRTMGQQGVMTHQPVVRLTPQNLRRFANTPHARKAINRIKNSIAMLDWEVRPKKDATDSKVLQEQCRIVKACLDSPNRDDNFQTFIEQVIEDVLVVSAGAYEQQVSSDPARPLWLWPVDGQSILIYPDWDGKAGTARYRQVIGYGNITGKAGGKDLLHDELVYLRPNPTTASPYGTGPLEIAFETINRLLGAQRYAGKVASNAQPENMLYMGDMDDRTLAVFRNYWKLEIEGQGVTPIYGNKIKPEAIKLHHGSDDALYLKWQEFLIRAIASAFGLSALSLNLEGDVNRNTAEVTDDKEWDEAIKPLAKLVQAHLNRRTIAGRLGMSQVEFVFLGLDREDELALVDIYAKAYANNAMTPNEFRSARGQPPLDNQWGDMVFADMQVALNAARGAGIVDDKALDISNKDAPATAQAPANQPKGKDQNAPKGQKRSSK